MACGHQGEWHKYSSLGESKAPAPAQAPAMELSCSSEDSILVKSPMCYRAGRHLVLEELRVQSSQQTDLCG